jgi:ATP-dependent Clp protease adaptor protein ClpS
LGECGCARFAATEAQQVIRSRGSARRGILYHMAVAPQRAARLADPAFGPRSPKPAVADPEVTGETELHESLAPLWRVICHDDPVTTMNFVVDILQEVFRLPQARAYELMLRVHHTGSAVIGRWPESTAKQRVERARAKARAAGFPLTFTVERDD